MSEKKPVKVIHMAPLGAGGISKLTITINRLINRERVQFDYLVFRDRKEFLEEEAVRLGARKKVIDVENVHNDVLKFVVKFYKMKKLFKREQYDVVHVDASTPYDVFVAMAAKCAGVKRIVLHSHNDDFNRSKPLRDLFIPIYKVLMQLCVTDYFTISEKAAEFMFPKSVYKKKTYTLVRNGIDTEDYRFSADDRKKVRKELSVENKVVIGHIGRFVYQKNHDFILEVFKNFCENYENSVLLLVGDGVLQNEMRDKAKQLGISDKVIFYGTTHDVRKVLLAMDTFIFPSRFEGLGIAAIEAQATGLLTICADSIVDEVNITDCFKRIHGWDSKEWAKQIAELINNNTRDGDRKEQVIKAGYDIRDTVKQLEEFYISSQK